MFWIVPQLATCVCVILVYVEIGLDNFPAMSYTINDLSSKVRTPTWGDKEKYNIEHTVIYQTTGV